MSKDKHKNTPLSLIERMKQEQEAARENSGKEQIASQLTHESSGEPDFAELARRLEERKATEVKTENIDHVKMTIYVQSDVANAFNALITKRGQQKEFVNQALRDFIKKKVKELNLD